jgi:hypothetical protein
MWGFGETTRTPPDLMTQLFRNGKAVAALRQDIHMGVERVGEHTLELHYGGEPVLRPGVGREVWVTVDSAPAHDAQLRVPDGWVCEKLGAGRFLVNCGGTVAPRNAIGVSVTGTGEATFAMLGPDEARGFAAGDNVAKCPDCQARVEACICEPEQKRVRERLRGRIAYVRSWRVVGPFPALGKSVVSLDDPTPVERLLDKSKTGALDTSAPVALKPGKRLAWKPVRTSPDGLVDFAAALGAHDLANAFAYAQVKRPADGTVTLGVASDDGVRVWVNGTMVHSKEIGRACADVADAVEVPMHKGVNHVLVKVDNYTGDWGLRLGVA